MTTLTDDARLTARWAAYYRLRGWCPLPSDPATGHPPMRYADWWQGGAPADLFDRWPLPSVQLMCGRRWRLVVVDLDGPEAPGVWGRWGRTPRTWVTHSGGGGRHVWFTVDPDGPPIPKAILWRGSEKHSLIERFGDRSLITAPPSLHRKNGRRYRFLDRHHSPAKLPMPAPAPAWLLAREPIEQRPAPGWTPPKVADRPRRSCAQKVAGRIDRRAALAAVPDKIGLAASWGLRVAGRPSPKGWCPCHAFDRPDSNPSARIHRDTGTYQDFGAGLRLSFFDLAVALRGYADWREAAADLGGIR